MVLDVSLLLKMLLSNNGWDMCCKSMTCKFSLLYDNSLHQTSKWRWLTRFKQHLQCSDSPSENCWWTKVPVRDYFQRTAGRSARGIRWNINASTTIFNLKQKSDPLVRQQILINFMGIGLNLMTHPVCKKKWIFTTAFWSPSKTASWDGNEGWPCSLVVAISILDLYQYL